MMRFAENANYYIYTTFLLAYGPAILVGKNDILLATMIMAGLGLFTIRSGVGSPTGGAADTQCWPGQ